MRQVEMVGHVDAVFGGKAVRFELPRDPETIKRLETSVGSPNAAWGRFLTGAWTVADIRAVIAMAHPAPRGLFVGLTRAPLHGIDGKLLPARAGATNGVPPERIDPVLASRPLATYAPLAAAILQAFLIGLRPQSAVFDERTALDQARKELAPATGDGEAA